MTESCRRVYVVVGRKQWRNIPPLIARPRPAVQEYEGRQLGGHHRSLTQLQPAERFLG